MSKKSLEPKQHRTVAATIIARNAGSTFGRCLASIKPYCDQIIVVLGGQSDDDTEAIARSFGCEVYPFEWVDDFAAARNATLAHVNTEFFFWIDTDDELVGGENIQKHLAVLPDSHIGFWWPYHYGHDEFGNVNTVFDRERLFRTNVGWKWEGRIHETCAPLKRGGDWLRTQDIYVKHLDHDREGSLERNLRLLEMSHKENPTETRTIFYLGNQYFAMRDFRNAIKWWEIFTVVGDIPFEIWWAWVYLAKAYRELGAYEQALRSDFQAIEMYPEFKDPYFGLGATYCSVGDYPKAIEWVNIGLAKREPPTFVFRNPLDYTFDPQLTLMSAYGGMGEVEKSLKHARAAYRVRETATLGAAIDTMLAVVRRKRRANTFLKRIENWKEDRNVYLEGKKLDHALYALPEIRARVGGAAHRIRRDGKKPQIAFLCGDSLEPWSPLTLETTGIGGSETAVVHVARRFAEKGYQVDVYNNPGMDEGVHEGVGYWHWNRYPLDAHPELLVIWRNIDLIALAEGGAEKTVLWSHDLHYGDQIDEEKASRIDEFLCVSDWHRQYFERRYPFLKGKVGFVPNGIDLSRFDPTAEKQRAKVVYSSSRAVAAPPQRSTPSS